MKNQIRATMNLYTCCNHGEPKNYICTLTAGQNRMYEQIFNILAIKYGNNDVVEYLNDTVNCITWWRKKGHKYPKFVLLPDTK